MVASLLALLIVGIVVLVAATVVLAVFGAIFSIALAMIGFVLFKVVPVLLVGWLVVKLIQRASSSGEISASDTAWLDR